MARLLFIHIRYPEFDRCSGDVRVTNMLRALRAKHEVALHILYQEPTYLHSAANDLYARTLHEIGVRVESGSLVRHLRRFRYDVVVIEFWYVAQPIFHQIRVLQPSARIVVDTEHIYFYSERLREAVLGSAFDSGDADERKRNELEAYQGADGIITTTDEDRDVVLAEVATIRCRTIPNIHALPDAPIGDARARRRNSIVFIGNFRNNPSNADAMMWFCTEILPLILQRVPDSYLRIVGNMPPPEIVALASAHIEVTGYVPDTAPYLDDSMVSVCPLRFGAGLKGKIGEAMSYGLPVVTTSVGTQGMSPQVGTDLLAADEPSAFADAVARLFEDQQLWRAMSLSGRHFIEANFGFAAVERKIAAAFDDLSWLSFSPVPFSRRWLAATRMITRDMFDEHITWRIRS